MGIERPYYLVCRTLEHCCRTGAIWLLMVVYWAGFDVIAWDG